MNKLAKTLAGLVLGSSALAGCTTHQDPVTGKMYYKDVITGKFAGWEQTSPNTGVQETILGMGVKDTGIRNNDYKAVIAGDAMINYGTANANREDKQDISLVNQNTRPRSSDIQQRETNPDIGLVNIVDRNGDGVWDRETETADWDNPSMFYKDSYMLVMASGEKYGGKTVRVLIRDPKGGIIGEGAETQIPSRKEYMQRVGNLPIRDLIAGYRSASSDMEQFKIELYDSASSELIGERIFNVDFNDRNPGKISATAD